MLESRLFVLLIPLLGCFLILLGCTLASKHRRLINWGLVFRAFALQWIMAIVLFKVPQARELLKHVGEGIEQLQHFADVGSAFVFGGFVSKPEALQSLFGPEGGFIFALQLVPIIVFVAALVSYLYHIGVLPWVVRLLSTVVNRLIGVSGAEALSNTASVFVGQVEAQLLIKPYLGKLTQSELLAVMTGSFACISGGMMAVYISMGIPASFLLTASVMSIPSAFLVSKLLLPDTHEPQTRGAANLKLEKKATNWVDALAQGAAEGWHIGVSVLAMLIAFVALVAMVNAGLHTVGEQCIAWGWLPAAKAIGFPLELLSLSSLLGWLFYWLAVGLGIPLNEASTAASLLGTKLMLNEFVAYSDMLQASKHGLLSPLSQAILSVALCGFANLGSVAMQLGGIGAMVPERRSDLAQLGIKAMIAGTLASYLSAITMGLMVVMQQGHTPSWVWWGIITVALAVLLLSHLVPAPVLLPRGGLRFAEPPLSPASHKAMEAPLPAPPDAPQRDNPFQTGDNIFQFKPRSPNSESPESET